MIVMRVILLMIVFGCVVLMALVGCQEKSVELTESQKYLQEYGTRPIRCDDDTLMTFIRESYMAIYTVMHDTTATFEPDSVSFEMIMATHIDDRISLCECMAIMNYKDYAYEIEYAAQRVYGGGIMFFPDFYGEWKWKNINPDFGDKQARLDLEELQKRFGD